jgi:hypothetical protein
MNVINYESKKNRYRFKLLINNDLVTEINWLNSLTADYALKKLFGIATVRKYSFLFIFWDFVL